MTIADEKEYRDKFLKCPFCLARLDNMEKITTPFGNDIEGGMCECGAAYVFDLLGKNMGDAYTDALAMAFDWDYDAAYRDENESFEETVVRYHPTSGKYLLGDGSRLDRSPKFIFVRRVKAR